MQSLTPYVTRAGRVLTCCGLSPYFPSSALHSDRNAGPACRATPPHPQGMYSPVCTRQWTPTLPTLESSGEGAGVLSWTLLV